MSAADRYFVDSNLLLYYVDPSDARKQERAREWLEALWMTGAGPKLVGASRILLDQLGGRGEDDFRSGHEFRHRVL